MFCDTKINQMKKEIKFADKYKNVSTIRYMSTNDPL